MQDKMFYVLEAVHRTGIKLIIENFGKGVSSLFDLNKIPIYAFKIDESFIHDKENVLMLRSLIQLGKVLEAKLIASGVNTQESLLYLKDLDCDQAGVKSLFQAKSPQETTLLLAQQSGLNKASLSGG
jgi:EAL domain-containing protein (putative c-di-GMP-specific phosphodiesterase class I)